MTLSDLESHALLLSYQPRGQLTARRISEVLDTWLTVRTSAGDEGADAVSFQFSSSDFASVSDGVSRLVKALISRKHSAPWTVAVNYCVHDCRLYQEMVVAPIRPDATVTVWVQLAQGDVVQGRVQSISPPARPAFVAQAKTSLPGDGLHLPSGRLRQLVLAPGTLYIVVLPHRTLSDVRPVAPSASLQSVAHKLDLWGEIPLRAQEGEVAVPALQALQAPQPSQSSECLQECKPKITALKSEVNEKTNGDHWFESIPLPEVEPVTGELWDQLKADGVRLALLAAIRDQETAVARETQAGNMDLASLTARSLAEANVSLSKIEGILCV